MHGHGVEQVGIAGLQVPGNNVIAGAVRLDIRDILELGIALVGADGLGLAEGLRLEPAVPAVRAANEFQAAVIGGGLVQRYPDRQHLPAADRPVGLVVVPAGALAHGGFLDEQLVVEQVDLVAAEKGLGNGGQLRIHADVPEGRVGLPQAQVAVEQALVRLVAVEKGARLADVVLDGRGQPLQLRRRYQAAQGHHPVGVVGVDVRLLHGVAHGLSPSSSSSFSTSSLSSSYSSSSFP